MTKTSKHKHFKQSSKIKTPTVELDIRKPRQSKQAPKALDKLIQLANLPGEKLRPLIALDKEFPPPPPGDWPKDFAFRAWAGQQGRATLENWLTQRLQDFPKEFSNYVTEPRGGSHLLWLFGAVNRYEFIRDLQRKFRAIISAVRAAETTRRLPTTIYLETNNAVFIDDEWILRKQIDEFDAAVFGSDERIDARMIRQCEVCDLLFFARRVDSKVCDPRSKCAATLAKRNERANRRHRAELASRKRAKKARER